MTMRTAKLLTLMALLMSLSGCALVENAVSKGMEQGFEKMQEKAREGIQGFVEENPTAKAVIQTVQQVATQVPQLGEKLQDLQLSLTEMEAKARAEAGSDEDASVAQRAAAQGKAELYSLLNWILTSILGVGAAGGIWATRRKESNKRTEIHNRINRLTERA